MPKNISAANIKHNMGANAPSQRIILLVHGPNLNMLGRRDERQYGNLTLANIEELARKEGKKYDFLIRSFQSNYEGALIDWIQKYSRPAHGIIINPGAFTHYSYALHDAILDTKLPCIEVHLSNIMKREKWRRYSVIAPACIAQISGRREKGYVEALKMLASKIKNA